MDFNADLENNAELQNTLLKSLNIDNFDNIGNFFYPSRLPFYDIVLFRLSPFHGEYLCLAVV